jgi:hypothetical protein
MDKTFYDWVYWMTVRNLKQGNGPYGQNYASEEEHALHRAGATALCNLVGPAYWAHVTRMAGRTRGSSNEQ